MTKLLAFHNDKKIKEKYLTRIKAHAIADEIIQGQYWEEGKGCAVGCTIHGSSHKEYETQLGIPRIIARLEDKIFEGLSNEDAQKFPLQFLEAINVGADLSNVWNKFAVWLLEDTRKYLKGDTKAYDDVLNAYKKTLEGKYISLEERRVLTNAANANAADAYTTANAAYAAAAAAANANANAADAAYDAAKKNHYKLQAQKLLEILKETK